jgi:hypothetical protein
MTKQAPLSLDFNSPLLQAKIPVNRPGKRCRITIRVIIILSIFIILSGIAYRWFEPQSIGYVLYWLHDEIYLLIKGYTYTWGYPYSLLWWLTGLVLSGYWLPTYLMDIPLLRAFHIKTIRFCLYHDVLRGVLKTWIKWVKPTFFRATLLEKFVEHEQKRRLQVVDTAVIPNQDELQKLAITTFFKVDISLFSPRADGIEQKLISDLINTLIRFYLYKGYEAKKASDFFQDNKEKLWQSLYNIASMKSGLTTFDKALMTTVGFSELSLLAEMICLFEIRNKQFPYDNVWYQGMERVLMGIESRCQQLSVNRIGLEQLRWRHFDKQPIDLNKKPTTYEGRLAVDVALLFALFSEEPNASLAYIENIEALALTVAIADKQQLAKGLKPYFDQKILTYADYRICAELLARAKKAQYEELDKRSANGLFKQTDLALADASIAHFLHAAAADAN